MAVGLLLTTKVPASGSFLPQVGTNTGRPSTTTHRCLGNLPYIPSSADLSSAGLRGMYNRKLNEMPPHRYFLDTSRLNTAISASRADVENVLPWIKVGLRSAISILLACLCHKVSSTRSISSRSRTRLPRLSGVPEQQCHVRDSWRRHRRRTDHPFVRDTKTSARWSDTKHPACRIVLRPTRPSCSPPM